MELALAGGAGQARRGGPAAEQAPLRLMARLVRPGKNGGWVGGDLSWGRLDALRYSGDYSEQQVRLLRELYVLYQACGGRGGYYGYHYGDDRSIELSSIASRQLWPLLEEAEAAGLQLVYPGKRGVLGGHGEAEFCLDVTRGNAGGLRMVPLIRAGDGETGRAGRVHRSRRPRRGVRRPRPGSGRRARKLAVPAGQAGPAGAATAAADGIGGRARCRCPPPEEPRFLERYYPRLRQAAELISSDGSFSPPAICGPELVLRACYGSGHELEVSWEWAYRVGDSPLRVPAGGGWAGRRIPGPGS